MRAYFGFFLFFGGGREVSSFFGGGEWGEGVFFFFRDLPFVERDSLLAVNPAKFDTLNR